MEIYELEQVGAQYCLVMECVDAITLRDLIQFARARKRHIPITVVVDILIQISTGLAFAHALEVNGVHQNVVHRDLKPENILVSRSGDVKVADFGIAKFAMRGADKTKVGITRGTPLYMSPEQAVGSADLRASSDVFSLGAILFELCTLNPAFPAASLRDILVAIVKVDPNVLVEKLGRRASDLGWMLPNCLSQDLKKRYTNAGLVLTDLEIVRSTLAEGPTLQEWMEEHAEALPVRISDDEFGEDGPPPSINPTIEMQNISIFVRPLDRQVAEEEEYLEVPEGEILEESGMATQTGESGSLSASTGRIFLVPALLLLLVGLVVFFWSETKDDTVVRAPTPPAPTAEDHTPEPPAVLESLSEAFTESATPSPTSTPVVKRTERRPASAPTPEPVLEEPDADPTPEPMLEPAFLVLHARPKATVILDGTSIGETPITGYEMKPGAHTVVLRCIGCQSASEETLTFVAAPGVYVRYVENFNYNE